MPDPGGQVRSLPVGLPDPWQAGRLRFAGRVDHGLVPALGGGSGTCWPPGHRPEPVRRAPGGPARRPLEPARPDDPAPVFVRPEVAVEVTFPGWEGGWLRHPAYSGLAAAGR